MTRKKTWLMTIICLFGILLVRQLPMVRAKYTTAYDYSFLVKTEKVPLQINTTVISYTGSDKVIPINEPGYYVFEVWGANGGASSKDSGGDSGGMGGVGDHFMVVGYLDEGGSINISVGGVGDTPLYISSGTVGGAGGYNGGAAGGSYAELSGRKDAGGGGGGATSISVTNNLAFDAHLIVAGGGGGGGAKSASLVTNGGAVSSLAFAAVSQGNYEGMYRKGLDGFGILNEENYTYGGGGSTQGGIAKYAFVYWIPNLYFTEGVNGSEGFGGQGAYWAGGGGGGFYGGAGASSNLYMHGGGGAGSSFFSNDFQDEMVDCVEEAIASQHATVAQPQNGNGHVIMSYIGTTSPY